MSLILEGIHLFPGLVDAHASDSLVVHVVLSVEDASDHEHRFELRAGESQRPAAGYDDGLDAIRRLQQHIVATARRSAVPVVENRDEDATVRWVLDGSASSVTGRGAPRPVVAEAFETTFWWVLAFTALALVPAAFLPRRPAVARGRREGAARKHLRAHAHD